MQNRYVTFRDLGDKGRLGNQLFQIAAVLGVCEKYGFKPHFSPSWQYNQFLETNLPFESQILVQVDDGGMVSYSIPENITHHYIEEYFHFKPFDLSEAVFKPSSSHYQPYDPIIYNLDGYFQSEKYFPKTVYNLNKIFTMNDFLYIQMCNKLLERYGVDLPKFWPYKESCAIHVRRGDYVDNAYYYQLGMDYYCEAMKLIQSACNNVVFVVFSDDIDWCKKHFTDRGIIFMEGFSEFEDLTIMSKCTHFITANSSFSWWGAFLGTAPNKKIIQPSKWFGPAVPHNTQDIYFENSCNIIP